jgi:hypothetical protein
MMLQSVFFPAGTGIKLRLDYFSRPFYWQFPVRFRAALLERPLHGRSIK